MMNEEYVKKILAVTVMENGVGLYSLILYISMLYIVYFRNISDSKKESKGERQDA